MYNNDKIQGCPRGFEWSEEKEECVPERGGVDEKLMLKAERYFFKEDTCPEGTVWCPVRKRCIPEKEMQSHGQGKGKGFGKGKGPVGVPKKEDITMEKVDSLVDEVFDVGFAFFGKVRKAEKKIDRLIDNVSITGRPYDHPLKMKIDTTPNGSVEIDVDESMGPINQDVDFEGSDIDGGETPSKEDNPQKISNDINHVPDQNVGGLKNSIHAELGEGMVWKMVAEARKDDAYKEYFKRALAKHGYKSPADIPADKKAAFFNAVDAGWTSAKEKGVNEGFFGGGVTKQIKAEAGRAMMTKYRQCMASTKNSGDSFGLRDLKCAQPASAAALSSLKSGINKCDDDKCRESIKTAINNHQIGMKKRIINIKNKQAQEKK